MTLVGGLDQIPDQRNLVRDLGATENREQRPLRVLEHRRERLQFGLHQKAGDLLRQVHPDNRGMRAMGGAKGIVHVNVAELRQARAKRRHRRRIGFLHRAVRPLHLALFLNVKAQVLQEHDIAGSKPGAGRLDGGPDAIVEKRHGPSQQLGEFGGDRFEREFRDPLAVRPPQMAHQHDGGAFFQRVANGWQRRHNALVVCDRAGRLVERDVKVDPREHALGRRDRDPEWF